MNDFKENMKARTRKAAIIVLKTCDELPESTSFSVVKRQLLRCATSVGANYRAACRARSRADFLNKLQIVEEECDETMYWIEVLLEMTPGLLVPLQNVINEYNEILSIVVRAIKTAKGLHDLPKLE